MVSAGPGTAATDRTAAPAAATVIPAPTRSPSQPPGTSRSRLEARAAAGPSRAAPGPGFAFPTRSPGRCHRRPSNPRPRQGRAAPPTRDCPKPAATELTRRLHGNRLSARPPRLPAARLTTRRAPIGSGAGSTSQSASAHAPPRGAGARGPCRCPAQPCPSAGARLGAQRPLLPESRPLPPHRLSYPGSTELGAWPAAAAK